MSKFEHFDSHTASQSLPHIEFNHSDLQILKNIDAAKTSASLPLMKDALRSGIQNFSADVAPQPASTGHIARAISDNISVAPETSPASDGSKVPTDIGSLSPQEIKEFLAELPRTDLDKITLTTPAEDASKNEEPDFYLNAEGKLVKNPKAQPGADGKIKIEVEGNNSAKKAEQYANKLQKEHIQYLVEAFKHDHPGEKVPEMWQSFLDSQPDNSYPNEGNEKNNSTVTPQDLQQYADNPSEQGGATPIDHKGSTPQDSSDGGIGTHGGSGINGDSGGSSGSRGEGGGSGGAGGGGGYDGGGGSFSNIPNQVWRDGGAPTDGLNWNSGTIENYDGNPSHMSDTQQRIVAQAEQSLGNAMWGGWSAASAEEGCAASVSQILNDAGVADLHNAHDCNCDGVQADLLAQGWTMTNTPQPGDVWIGRGGESEAHTGIIGMNGTLMDNHSNSGFWSQDSASYTGAWNNCVFLKPPDASHPVQDNSVPAVSNHSSSDNSSSSASKSSSSSASVESSSNTKSSKSA